MYKIFVFKMFFTFYFWAHYATLVILELHIIIHWHFGFFLLHTHCTIFFFFLQTLHYDHDKWLFTWWTRDSIYRWVVRIWKHTQYECQGGISKCSRPRHGLYCLLTSCSDLPHTLAPPWCLCCPSMITYNAHIRMMLQVGKHTPWGSDDVTWVKVENKQKTIL